MLMTPHCLDPNLLDFSQNHDHYIYADDYGNVAARVDAEDYRYFSQWRWAVKYDKRGRKAYLYRTLTERTLGLKSSLYLHVAIKERADPYRPPGHTIVDHLNGETLECRKFNLKYATPSMNAKNRVRENPRVNGRFSNPNILAR